MGYWVIFGRKMQTLLTLSQKVFKELDHKCKESQPIDLIYIFNVMHAEE